MNFVSFTVEIWPYPPANGKEKSDKYLISVHKLPVIILKISLNFIFDLCENQQESTFL